MKIIVINPPAYKNKEYIREGRCMQTKSSWAALWMPLSLAYISALLRQNGHNVLLIDCVAARLNSDDLLKSVQNFSPQLAVVNTAFPSIEGDMKIVGLIKKIMPETKTAVIGMYPTLLEKKCLENFEQVDYAIVGEPEWAVSKLANALNNKKPITKINGLIYRLGQIVCLAPTQDFSQNNPDQLPFPARDLLDNNKYLLPTNGEKFTLLSVGRGCPYNCIFCVANVYYGKKFRKRSVDSIVDEIEECIKKYNIKNFLFWGENFTLEPDYGERICDQILKRNIKISWSTTSRVDTLNEKLLKKMKLAGCVLLGLGIESASQEILNSAKKGTNLVKIEKAISMVKNSGISSIGHFIFGLPGETKKTAKTTIDFACKIGLNYAQFYCAIPYPKTELGRTAEKNNWIEISDFSQFDLYKSVMRNENLSPKDIEKLRNKAFLKFYFRPKMILQMLPEIKSFKSFFSTLNFLKWIKPS